MSYDLTSQGIELMKAQRFAEAILFFRKTIEEDASHWGNWYMAGQCYRFINDLENAVTYLKRATALNSDQPQTLLALGIALQLTNHLIDAIDAHLVELLKLIQIMNWPTTAWL